MRLMQVRQKQSGAGLIEVLIAVLVLAIGLLGLAGLQMTSLRSNQSAAERSVGVIQSYSIVEAIRADIDGAKSGAFNIDKDADPSGSSFASSSITFWREQLKANLGADATGEISCDSERCEIVVIWDDSRGLSGSASQQLVTEVFL